MKPEDFKDEIGPGGYRPGQYPDPLEEVPKETLILAQKDFEAELEKRITEKGVWHDMTTYFVYAQKGAA